MRSVLLLGLIQQAVCSHENGSLFQTKHGTSYGFAPFGGYETVAYGESSMHRTAPCYDYGPLTSYEPSPGCAVKPGVGYVLSDPGGRVVGTVGTEVPYETNPYNGYAAVQSKNPGLHTDYYGSQFFNYEASYLQAPTTLSSYEIEMAAFARETHQPNEHVVTSNSYNMDQLLAREQAGNNPYTLGETYSSSYPQQPRDTLENQDRNQNTFGSYASTYADTQTQQAQQTTTQQEEYEAVMTQKAKESMFFGNSGTLTYSSRDVPIEYRTPNTHNTNNNRASEHYRVYNQGASWNGYNLPGSSSPVFETGRSFRHYNRSPYSATTSG